jgi:hypothetical protein
LPLLLESTDLDKDTLDALAGGKARRACRRFRAGGGGAPEHQAFIVKKWGEAAKEEAPG